MGGLLTKGVEYEADGVTVKQCLFCDIAANKKGLRQTEVAYEDEKVRCECVDGIERKLGAILFSHSLSPHHLPHLPA